MMYEFVTHWKWPSGPSPDDRTKDRKKSIFWNFSELSSDFLGVESMPHPERCVRARYPASNFRSFFADLVALLLKLCRALFVFMFLVRSRQSGEWKIDERLQADKCSAHFELHSMFLVSFQDLSCFQIVFAPPLEPQASAMLSKFMVGIRDLKKLRQILGFRYRVFTNWVRTLRNNLK